MRATVICNPRAGRRSGEDGLQAALRVLEGADWLLDVEGTDGPGDAARLARLAADKGQEAVIVAGGDGTINEVVQGLAGTDTALGYLPYGTVNAWARQMSIPLEAERAARAMIHGRIERVDLGVANGRYFLLMAGMGFDAAVLQRAQTLERYKHRIGVLPYVAGGLSVAPFYRGADVELRYDGVIRRIQALLLVLGNTRLYGGRFQLTPGAVANDGWLDLCIVRGRGPLALARQSLPLLVLGSLAGSDVELLRVRELTVSAEPALPLQLDGELCGATPATFTVAPRALRAIVPRGLKSNVIT